MSWIRLSDTSLLAVGGYTYTSDLRLESSHEQGTRDWVLTIRNVSVSDAGQYECQVSTSPHMSTVINLSVEGNNSWIYEPILARKCCCLIIER